MSSPTIFNFTLEQNQYLLVGTLLWILHEILLSFLQSGSVQKYIDCLLYYTKCELFL